MAKDMAVDFSVLDPESVASSSTPKMSKAVNGVRLHQTKIQPNEEENESVYSLHLSALGPLSPMSTLQDDHELRAELEEPGGPSDFTQNMFDWINGPAKHNEAAAYQSPQSVIHSHTQQAQIDEAEESEHEQDTKHSTLQDKPLLDMTAEEVEEKFAKLQARCDELQTMWDTLNARFQKQKLKYAEEARLQKEKMETAQSARLEKEFVENARGVRTPDSRKSSTHDEVRDAQIWQHKHSNVDDADQETNSAHATIQSQQNEIDQLKQQLKNEQVLRRKERDAASIREAELVRSYESMMQQLADSNAKSTSSVQNKQNVGADRATPIHDSIKRNLQKAVDAKYQNAHAAENESRVLHRATSPEIDSSRAKTKIVDGAVSPGQTAADAKTRRSDATAELEQIVVRLQDKLASEREVHAAAILALKAEYDAVEKDVDAWMLDQVEQRKLVTDASASKKDKKILSLQTKVEELEHLNARYEKELMLSWGREEFGRAPPGEKQKYRYRYT